MGNVVSISFEGSDVKIVHALKKGENVIVERTERIADTEFDNYLQREKAAEFIVTCDFKESFHDKLTIPIVEPKYLKKIIESEIRKSTGKKDFSFVYSLLGERIIDNKKMHDIYYLMVNREGIENVIERFYRQGKMVNALYPAVFPAAFFVSSHGSGETNLGIIGSGKERTLFFTKNRTVHFIRNYDSLDEEFSDFDVQNVNMTINYCFQNIRINPSSVILLGNLSELSTIKSLPDAPLSTYCAPQDFQCDREVFNEYFLPLGSLHVEKSANILSQEFRNVNMIKKSLTFASMVFVLIALFFLGFNVYEVTHAFNTRKQIHSAITDQSVMDRIYTEYMEKEEVLSKILPAIEFLNRPSADIQDLLIDLTEINMEYLDFDSIEAQAKGDSSISFSISGTSFAQTYSSFQSSFDRLTDELDRKENIVLEHRTINLKDKSFKIELRYEKSDELQALSEE